MKCVGHWTANEDNADRVSYAEYARQTGVGESTVRMAVQRYANSHSVRVDSVRTSVGSGRQSDGTDDQDRDSYVPSGAFAECEAPALQVVPDLPDTEDVDALVLVIRDMNAAVKAVGGHPVTKQCG